MEEHPGYIPLTDDELQARVIYRDSLVIILDKPIAMPVHAGPKGGPSLEDYFGRLQFGYKETPHLAHRLDRDTSGCLILGRNHRALRKLGRLFETGQVQKTYWAVVEGAPAQESGVIDTPLRKVKMPKGWSMQPCGPNDPEAQAAVTEYKTLRKLGGGRTLLELYPKTGRTHQIRVHLQSIGCPIVNDWLYGANAGRPETFAPLFLHARSVTLPLYPDAPPLTVTAEPPPHMAALIS
jgi:RluA family pseudouridine synthase